MKNIMLLFLTLINLICYSQKHVIYFDFDKSDLRNQQIDELKNQIRTKKVNKLDLYGYADTLGTVSYNRILVERRLTSVRNQLIKIDSNLVIHATNFGEENSTSPIDKENRKVVVKFETEKYETKKPNYNKVESFKINNSKDTIIECKKGTRLYIPNNSFVLENGKSLLSSVISFRVTEYYLPSEMIDANLTTQSNNEVLETRGMLYIEAYSNNLKCILKKEKQLGIKFNNISPADSMQIFNGVIVKDNINWNLSNSKEIVEKVDSINEVYLVVENMPTFNGGDIKEFRKYINQNLKYPTLAIENGIFGRVFVQFVIDEVGNVTNPRVIRGIAPVLDEEALRVIKNSPRWIPGTQRGKPVPVSMTFPITFTLDFGQRLPIQNNDTTNFSKIADSIVNDSIIAKRTEAAQFFSQFYLWADKLNWINCDKFSKFLFRSELKIQVSSEYETIYAVFNNTRSIIAPDSYDENQQIKWFKSIPSNQDVTIIGIKIVNRITYFSNLKIKPSDNLIKLEYKEIDSKELKNELKQIGI